MTMVKEYVSIALEDDLRREFDELVARGKSRSASFDSWMKRVNHYRYDDQEKKYYYFREARND